MIYSVARRAGQCEDSGTVTERTEMRARRDGLGWSQRQLATQAGVNVETVVRAEAGEDIKLTTLGKLIAAIERGEADLPSHTGTRVLDRDTEPFAGDIERGYIKNDVPVVGEAEASSNGLIVWGDDGVLRAQVERWVSRSFADGDPKAYGLVVRNDSMVERYFPGEVVVAQPRLEVRDGHFAVVYLKSGERLVKRVFRKGDGWLLRSSNTAYPDREVKIDDVLAMHRIKHSIAP